MPKSSTSSRLRTTERTNASLAPRVGDPRGLPANEPHLVDRSSSEFDRSPDWQGRPVRAMSLLADHVRRLNEGVRTGDFSTMAAALTEDAEMHVEGVSAGAVLAGEAGEDRYPEQRRGCRGQ